ncbi:hypothetical protein [Elizabethkingia anophelis]|uniref:hypothetical protein n=1 Tax=Elizabethkingia anophelis TaxID=1117645 RepID=UPI003891D6E8
MKFSKGLIIGLSAFVGLIIIIITLQVIYSTEDPAWIIDFGGKDNTISSYGVLIGALLSFLSITFVLFNIVEDRAKIEKEKNENLLNEIESYNNWMKIISIFLGTIIKDIKTTGENLKEFAEKELEAPAQLHTMVFTVNKSFSRISEIDKELIFKIFQSKIGHLENWEETYTDLYRFLDFYEELLPHIREKYGNHAKDKFEKLTLIGQGITDLMTTCQKLIDYYIVQNSDSESPYLEIVANFNADVHRYMESCFTERTPQSFETILEQHVSPLIRNILDTQNSVGSDTLFEQQILEKASGLRRELWGVEENTKDFANNVLRQYSENFSELKSENLIDLIKLKKTIDDM